jgi:prepilin-type N-terminal cleavage/methylation domain-containing protein
VKGLRSVDNRGFGLIEVLAAMAILSLGLVGTAALLVGTIRASEMSRKISIATMLSQEKVEEFRTLGYLFVSSSDTTVVEDYGSIPNHPKYYRVSTIEVDTPNTKAKTITVDVHFPLGSRPVTIEAILVR